MARMEATINELLPFRLWAETMEWTRRLDPMRGMMVPSSETVVPVNPDTDDGGYKFTRPLKLGLAGAARFVRVGGPHVVGSILPLQMIKSTPVHLAATEATIPGYDQITGVLARMRGTIVLPKKVLEMNALADIASDVYADILEGNSLRVNLQLLASWHTPSTTTRHICSVSDVAVAVDGVTLTFVPAEGNEVLFAEGAKIQFYKVHTDGKIMCRHTTDGTDIEDLDIIVTAVHPDTRQVACRVVSGENRLNLTGDWAASNAVQNGDIVVYQGQLFGGAQAAGTPTGDPVAVGTYGWLDFMVNAGNLFGVSTDTFTRLKALITANLGGPLTEHEVDLMLTHFNRWRREKITTLYMTPGVALAHKDTMLGMFTADRTGEPAKIVGGHTGMYHVHDGVKVLYATSPYLRAGVVVGYCDDTGFMMLTPPTYGDGESAETLPEGYGKIKFAMRGGQMFNDVLWARAGGGAVVLTELKEAPYSLDQQVFPRKFGGILMAGVTETNWDAFT